MAKRKRYKKPDTGVRFARVPSGGETCRFCIMLASRGAVYYSEESAGKNNHYHANCRCRIVPSWGLAQIEGYDPDLYYDMWKNPEKYAQPTDGTSIAAELAEEVAPVVRVPLDAANFPDVFTDKKANAKKTQAFIDTVNAAGVADPKMLDIYNNIGRIVQDSGVDVAVKHTAADHKFSYRGWVRPWDVAVYIPKMEGEELRGQAVTTAHELGHLIDHFSHDVIGADFSDGLTKRLWGIVTKLRETPGTPITKDALPKKVRDISEALKGKNKEIRKALRKEADEKLRALFDEVKGRYTNLFKGDEAKADIWARYDDEYIKKKKKIVSDYEKRFDYESRNLFGCWAMLEDIYDALSNGRLSDTGAVTFGHGSKYFDTEGIEAEEIWANFCAISVLQPDLLAYIEESHPELLEELEKLRSELWGKYGAKI